jgi:hypothetical protein
MIYELKVICPECGESIHVPLDEAVIFMFRDMEVCPTCEEKTVIEEDAEYQEDIPSDRVLH